MNLSDCVCGCKPEFQFYKSIVLVKCNNCGRFSTGDSRKEAATEWEVMIKHETQDR